jgi:hypothetical protein
MEYPLVVDKLIIAEAYFLSEDGGLLGESLKYYLGIERYRCLLVG